MTCIATDQRANPRTASARVTVNILRNRFRPVFVNTPYGFSHSENVQVGTSQYRVSAVDSDLVGRINYDVIGDGIAPYYYSVNSLTGDITIRNALTTDRLNVNYVVSIYLTIASLCHVLLQCNLVSFDDYTCIFMATHSYMNISDIKTFSWKLHISDIHVAYSCKKNYNHLKK